MTDEPSHRDDSDADPDRGSGTSRWGKVILFVVLGLALVFVVVLHLVGGGFRGPH